MKTYNEKHEAIIVSEFEPIKGDKDYKDGDIVPHKNKVKHVYMYHTSSQTGKTKRIWISRDELLDLAKEIAEIENQIKDLPFDAIPF